MNAIRRAIIAALALTATLATTTLVISPVALAHPVRAVASGQLASSTARAAVHPHTRTSKV